MLLVEMTGATLTRALGLEVCEEYVVIAKHQVLGFDDQTICDILGCEMVDLETAKEDAVFKSVKAMVNSAHAQATLNQAQGWDALEGLAIKKLVDRIPKENDSEFLLKVAAIANRATRKTQADDKTLDPLGKGVSRISLTSRLVQRISHSGAEQVEERQLSITSGSMGRATFKEVNELLEVKPTPVLPRELEVQTHVHDPDANDLLDDLMSRIRR